MEKKLNPIYLKIADFVIKIIFNQNPWSPLVDYWHELFHDKCGKWIVDDSYRYDAILQFSQQKLFVWNDKLNKRYYARLYEHKDSRFFETYYHISFYHFTAILRIILQDLLQSHNGFLLHCSANRITPQSVCIFIGKSDAGKSTISYLLQPEYPKIADDTIAVIKKSGFYYLYPLPIDNPTFTGSKFRTSYKIGKIFILEKSHQCKSISIQDRAKLLSFLISSLWIEDINKSNRILIQIKDLIYSHREFYILQFTKNKKELLSFFSNSVINSA